MKMMQSYIILKTFVRRALQKASQYILPAKIIKALKILDRDIF